MQLLMCWSNLMLARNHSEPVEITLSLSKSDFEFVCQLTLTAFVTSPRHPEPQAALEWKSRH
jgi:hypothetical protein